MLILVAILVLGFLIVVHEFGHFIVAKRMGIGVERFSVGFGPRMLTRQVGETEYALSAIPLGGYVKMVGEDPDADPDTLDEAKSFSHKSIPRRLAVVTAGPGFNILFAFVIFFVCLLAYGAQYPTEEAKIGAVMEGKPAEQAGLQEGDTITALDGEPIHKWTELAESIRASEGRPVELTLQRDGETLTRTVEAEKTDEKTLFGEVVGEAYMIGIAPASEYRHLGFWGSLRDGAQQTWFWSKTTVVSIAMLIQGRISREDLGGPILIVQAAQKQARHGLENLLYFMAVISINLGILNLLPIPVLDGGHVLFLSIEAAMRRPLDLRHREIAQQVGLVILLAVMAFAFYNDIARVIRGWG